MIFLTIRMRLRIPKTRGKIHLILDPNDLTRLNGCDAREASGRQWQQVFQTIRPGTENDNCDLAGSQILLVFDTLVHGKEDIEFACFRSGKKVAVLQSRESSVTGRLAMVTGQRVAESLIDTLVDQNAHLGTREQKLFCFFESSDGHLPRDGRKALQKVFERFSALQIVEQRLDRHACSAKHRSSAKNVRIFDNHSHEMIVSRAIVAGA